MANSSNQGSEMPYVVTVLALATIVGLLIFVQLLRGKPVDVPSMLIIAVCFVIGTVVTAMWGSHKGK